MIARACRYFGGTPDYWLDALTIPRLWAQEKELRIRPPLEEFSAIDHGYVPPGSEAAKPHNAVPPVSELPEIEE